MGGKLAELSINHGFCGWYATSAKTGENISEAIHKLIEKMISQGIGSAPVHRKSSGMRVINQTEGSTSLNRRTRSHSIESCCP